MYNGQGTCSLTVWIYHIRIIIVITIAPRFPIQTPILTFCRRLVIDRLKSYIVVSYGARTTRVYCTRICTRSLGGSSAARTRFGRLPKRREECRSICVYPDNVHSKNYILTYIYIYVHDSEKREVICRAQFVCVSVEPNKYRLKIN